MDKTQIITYSAVAAGGIAVGATGGFLVSKNQFGKSLRQIEKEVEAHALAMQKTFDDTVMELKAMYHIDESPIVATPVQSTVETPAPIVETTQKERTDYHKIVREQQYASPAEALQALRHQKPADITDEDVDRGESIVQSLIADGDEVASEEVHHISEQAVVFPEDEPRDGKSIFIISYEEYHDPASGQDRVPATFYEGDDILVDNMDKPIDIDLVGAENLTRFGDGAEEDPNELHIRNEEVGVDFQVYRDARSYSEMILGIDPDDDLPTEVKIRKPRREPRDD